MSAEIINLKQFRKQRARDEKDARAAENRVRFGRTKTEREKEERLQSLAGEVLDGHLRDKPIGAPTPTTAATDEAQPLEPAPKTPR
jgi:hypothetical protein